MTNTMKFIMFRKIDGKIFAEFYDKTLCEETLLLDKQQTEERKRTLDRLMSDCPATNRALVNWPKE